MTLHSIPAAEGTWEPARDVRSVYQPLIDLRTGAVVGFEALARGPAGTPLERPDLLFAEARRQGAVAELDWACRAAALEGALAAGLRPPAVLFVNTEPDTVDIAVPARHAATLRTARQRLNVVVEITERALAEKPAELLRTVEAIRARGWGVALDDVGADWRSLALMPFVRPDVVKLDMRLVQEGPSVEAAVITDAVRAYAAESGAHILAEGIETEVHRARALMLGATLGQGWLFARPGELTAAEAERAQAAPPLVVERRPLVRETPVEAVQDAVELRVAAKADLFAMSRAMERQALEVTEPAVILAAFQSARHFTPASAAMYARLARRSAFVGAFGEGLSEEPAPGVRGASLAANERLAGEWDVVVVGPHQAVALVARDLGDSGPDAQRRFRFALLRDRALVLRAARGLMLEIVARTGGGEQSRLAA
jgi:EAL domain-containing protein (putative c-di-GMP-specific phosphodiesterase class I)